MLLRLFLVACICLLSCQAYEQNDRDDAMDWLASVGFPPLKAFNYMTPKLIRTVMENYLNTAKEGAFEYLSEKDTEVIWAATSAANNCEMCLSFHTMAMAGHKLEDPVISSIASGGVPPSGSEFESLVLATKYALAHKGILLPREAQHLATMGIHEEMFLEINYAAHTMGALNAIYINMIANGLDLERFLKIYGPFSGTVYKQELDEAEF